MEYSVKNKAQSFIKISLVSAVASLMWSTAHAQTEQQQIEQLRQEVAALKALVQQQQQVQVQQQQQITQVTELSSPAPTVKRDGLTFTTKGGAEVKAYGFVRADANYIVEGADNDFNAVASSKGEAKDKLRSTLKTTRIGVDFSTPLENGNKLGGKIETDFASSSESLRMRHVYLTYNDWLIGQTLSTFLSNHAPEMIDFNTNPGGGTSRVPMVRYSHKIAPNTQVMISAEKGDSAASKFGDQDVKLKYSAPVLAAKVIQGFDEGKGSLSARALVEHYKADVGQDDAIAWGAAIGVNYQLTDPLKLSADYSYVQGNNKYLYAANTAFALDNEQKIEQNEFHALQVGATYKFSPAWRSTLAYGAVFADDSNAYANLNQEGNEQVQQAWLNFIYSPAKPVDLGIEYVNGKRETFKGESFKDNRIGLMGRYSF